MLSLLLASTLADDPLRTSSLALRNAHDSTTISFTREGMKLIQKAARRQGSSVSQFVREAALMRARMASDDNPYPMRALAEELRAIGEQGVRAGRDGAQVGRGRARAQAVSPTRHRRVASRPATLNSWFHEREQSLAR